MIKETKETGKKYYLVGTDEEVFVGDVISTTLTKEMKEGYTIKRDVEFELSEETIPYALEIGIIEEGEDNTERPIDFDDSFPKELDEIINGLCEDLENAEGRIDSLEEKIKQLEKEIKAAKKQTVSSKKK